MDAIKFAQEVQRIERARETVKKSLISPAMKAKLLADLDLKERRLEVPELGDQADLLEEQPGAPTALKKAK